MQLATRAAVQRRARRSLPTPLRRLIQVVTGVGGGRAYAVRWLLFPVLHRLTPAVMVRDGRIRLLVWTRDMVIPRVLFASRRGDSVQLAQALEMVDRRTPVPAGAAFVDVGANLGNAGLAALASGRFERVMAFEPDGRSLALLRANVALNDASDRVHIVPAGASDIEDAHATVALNPHNYGDNVIVESGSRGTPRPGASQPTSLVRLDRALPAQAGFVASRAFYWIDVQGHERRVLRGMGSLLDEALGAVLEFSPEHATPDDFAEIAGRLAGTHRWFAQLGREGAEPRPTEELPGFVAALARGRDSTDLVVFGRRMDEGPGDGTGDGPSDGPGDGR